MNINIDEAKKNIETAKRIIGRETEEPGSIWFGIAKSMVGIAEWALGELGAVKRELALTQGANTAHADAEFKARTAHNERERAWVNLFRACLAPLLAARCANKIDLPSDDFDYDAARAQYASKSKEELLDTIENLTRAARSLATQRDQLAAIGELKRELGSWPSYQEITSAWFGTESERVCFDGALRVLNLFRKHASTTQSPEPTTPAEAVAVRDGVDLDTEHALLSTLLNADNAVAIGKDPEAPNLWEQFRALLRTNNMTTGARPLYMADLRLFSKLLDR